MASSTITLPVNFTADLASFVSTQISNFSTYILLILGIILTLLVVEVLIGFFKK